jgi:omega-hydroxy-beta-dihydromenaquinone-9 sulfotransferase
MSPVAWWKLLRQGRFEIHPSRWAMALAVTLATPANALMGMIQNLVWGRRLSQCELHGPPIFIVGHWRSGTTLLHELLVLDERLSSPSTYQCFAPHHFLLSEWFFRSCCSWLLPGQRPMDNMAAGWDRPQEDEFALVNLGLPSPYRRIAFPNQPPPDMEYLDIDALPEEQQQRWSEALEKFLRAVSYRTERPLVVKSPTHTGRVATLARIFPGAKFIHISRDPRALFPSTVRLWDSLDEVQALQKPNGEGTEAYVVQCLEKMYQAFHRQRSAIDATNLIDIRYEDLIADPVAQVEAIYRKLRLGDFAHVRGTLTQWAETAHRDYKTNQHALPPEQEAMIRQRWAEYFDRYGY